MSFNILTTKSLLDDYIDYLNQSKISYNISPINDYVKLVITGPFNEELKKLLRNIEFIQIAWSPNGSINDKLDCIVLQKLLSKKIIVKTQDNIRLYYYEDQTPVNISNTKLDYFKRALKCIVNKYLYSIDPRVLLLPKQDNVYQHDYGLPIWYTENPSKTDNKELSELLSEWIWINGNSNLHRELCINFGLDTKVFGPINNDHYVFINVLSTVKQYITLGKYNDNAKDKFLSSLNLIHNGLLPIVTIKHGLVNIDTAKIHYAAVLILDKIFKEKNHGCFELKNHPRYLELFNYIKCYTEYIEIPIDCIENAIIFRLRLNKENWDNYKIGEGIDKHLSLKQPSLFLEDKVVYINDEVHNYEIDLSKITNKSDIISLEDFSDYSLLDKYKIIFCNSHGYHSDSLLGLSVDNKYPTLPLNRQPALVIPNINLMLNGIIDHHKPGILSFSGWDNFIENTDGDFYHPHSYISLPKIKITKTPHYDNMLFKEMENYDYDNEGYIIYKGEKIPTTIYSYQIDFGVEKINLLINDNTENFLEIHKKLIIKYTRGEFLPMWKAKHVLSTVKFYNSLPENKNDKYGAENDYILNWIKLN